jgi:hypothetical protein
MSGEALDHEGKDLTLLDSLILGRDIRIIDKMRLVFSVYERARRTFQEERDKSLAKKPEACKLYGKHLNSLRRACNDLYILMPFLDERSLEEDARLCVSSATKDILGIVNACDIALGQS